jgi:hypothetical protein
MYLIQLLIPLYDNAGQRFSQTMYSGMEHELAERFGGLTAFTRAPAQGLWKNAGETARDDIVVFEVMSPALDREWWAHYRASLEALFRQDHLIIRAQAIEPL